MSDQQPSDREAQVARLLRAAAQSERAPQSLRSEIDAMRARERPRRGFVLQLPRLVLGYAGVATTAVAVLVVALVLTLGGGGGLSIAQAAALATRGPAAPAPGPDVNAPRKLLSAHVGDLHFPNWEAVAGWRSTGQRLDRVGGRAVTTVYYASGHQTLAYSIVSAPALTGVQTHSEPYDTMFRHGRTIVIWQERNHTCVLSAAGISAPRLWELAVATF